MKYILTEKQLKLIEDLELKSRAPEQEKQREEYIKQILKKQITDITYQDYNILQEQKKEIINKFTDYLKEKYKLELTKKITTNPFNIVFEINKHNVRFDFNNLISEHYWMFKISNIRTYNFIDFSSEIQSSKYPFKTIEQLIKLQIEKLEKKEKLKEGLGDKIKSRASDQEKQAINYYTKKIMDDEYDIPSNIILKLPKEVLSKYVNYYSELIKVDVDDFLDNQNEYEIQGDFEDEDYTNPIDIIFDLLPSNIKQIYINGKLERGDWFTLMEFKHLTDEQLKKYIEHKIKLFQDEYNSLSNEMKIWYLDFILDYNDGRIRTPEQSDFYFNEFNDEQKSKYFNNITSSKFYPQFIDFTPKQKEYFKTKGLIKETIVKKDNQYCLKSKKGKNLGCYPTKSGAEKREKQVQYFKHLNEYQVSPGETVEWDLENNTTKINRLDGSIEWILENEHQTLPYLQKLFKTLNKQQIIEFSKKLYNKLSSGGNKRKIVLIGLVTAMINYGISKEDILHDFNNTDIEQLIQKEIKPIIEPKIEKQYRGDINDFLNLLAFKESSGNWKKIRYSKKTGNPVYIGKYQFGKIALEDLGINPDIISQFKDNPNIFPSEMQDKLVKRLLKRNKKYLGDNYLSYDGKTVGGVNVTESGLLAASHLRGARAVKKFIDSNGKIDLSDANGTKVSDYMKYFAGFDL